MFAAKQPPKRRSNSSKIFFVRRNNLISKVSFEENTPGVGSHGNMYLGTVPGDPGIYILPNRSREHANLLHGVEYLTLGPPPPRHQHERIPGDRPSQAPDGGKRRSNALWPTSPSTPQPSYQDTSARSATTSWRNKPSTSSAPPYTPSPPTNTTGTPLPSQRWPTTARPHRHPHPFPDWANIVRPLYKKGNWANPDNWCPVVYAVTEVKIVWTIPLRRIRPHLDPRIPASLWGAIPGRSAHAVNFHSPMILAAVFPQNSKSCNFRRAISSVHSSTVVFVFSQIFNKIMLSLELEPQINCRQLPRTRVSDSRPPCAIENRQKVHFFSQLEAK